MDNYKFRIKNIVGKYFDILMRNNNIISIGLGRKIINGYITDIPSVTICVRKKLSKLELGAQNVIPPIFYGVVTDVIESGSYSKVRVLPSKNNLNNYGGLGSVVTRPAKSGERIRNKSVYSNLREKTRVGVISYALIEKNSNKNNPGKKFALSTERVLTSNYIGKVNDEIEQLSPTGGKDEGQKEFGKVKKLGGIKISTKDGTISKNDIDAGIIEVEGAFTNGTKWSKGMNEFKLEKGIFNDEIINGSVPETDVDAGETICLFTRRYGKIICTVTAIGATTFVELENGDKVYYENQIQAKIDSTEKQLSDASALIQGSLGLMEYSDKNFYKIFGMFIGTAGGEKSNMLIFSPIETILKAMDKRLMVEF